MRWETKHPKTMLEHLYASLWSHSMPPESVIIFISNHIKLHTEQNIIHVSSDNKPFIATIRCKLCAVLVAQRNT